MAKITILKKRKKSGKVLLTELVPFSRPELKDPKLVVETLLECIRTGDIDSFREVLVVHFLTVNKTHFSKKTGLGRRTLYALIDNKKEFNPELSTISAIIKAIAS